jgi:Fe-S-cluster containining protein
MDKKDKKFISFPHAVDEIINDFRSEPNQYDLFAQVYSFLMGGKTVIGKKKYPPFGITYCGIWHKSNQTKKAEFYSLQDFDALLREAFSSKAPAKEDINWIYKTVMDVNAYIGMNSEGESGIWVETELEKFKCIQCGYCCLDLSGAFSTSADEEDIARWKKEKRWDILEYVVGTDLWISPITGEDVIRCPWLRKLPKKNKYICRIHETKPKHCRDYPKSKKHANRTGCNGFKVNSKDSQNIY